MFKESKMKTDVQKVSACRVKCVVEATAAEIDPIYQQVRAGFTKQVKMPGFRPGKAPWERIEALYGKQIQEEVNQRVISTLYHEVLKDESLKVETLVDIAAIRSAKGQGAEATFVVDLKPEFKTPDTAKWQVKKLDDAVTEEEVEERLAGARRMLASYVDATADDTATQNDLVAIAFTSDLDAATLSDAAKHYAADEEYWVQLQEDAFIPGLVGALLGKKLEETTQLTATYPADYRVTDLAGKTAFVGTYNEDAAAIGGKYVAEQIPGAKVAIIYGQEGENTSNMRRSGYKKGLEAGGASVIVEMSGENTTNGALAAMESILGSNPEVQAVCCHNDDSALGALQACVAAGRTDIMIIGFDGKQSAIDKIVAGELAGTVAQQPYDMGYQAVKAAYDAALGNSVEAGISVPAKLITKENAG